MEPFVALDAVALPIATANVDTDQIIPARFLYRQRGEGWAQLLFHDLRFNDDGSPRPQFVLNQPAYKDARIVVAQRNFGCGSSREHAVWCLYDYGVRAVIAPSFGDIFRNNSYQNGLLPVILPTDVVEGLIAAVEREPGAHIRVDLEAQKVTAPDGTEHGFDIDPFRKQCLLAGTDDMGFTLGLKGNIEAFEKGYERALPWL
jgi:3-isopropylmalate/(R)-2-methylmalate dehydratase small subunit